MRRGEIDVEQTKEKKNKGGDGSVREIYEVQGVSFHQTVK